MRLPRPVQEISRVFHESRYEVYLVGGTVRDRLLKKKTEKNDYDLATDAHPEEVMKLFRRVIPTGITHGTVTVLFNGCSFEVTTYREESTYLDHRHPDEVTYSTSILDDLKRRDFTINAMAVNGITGELIDAHGGMKDLKKRIIRAIGDPEERFGEDALRMLRGCRFASQLGFEIEEKTFHAAARSAHTITRVSAERVRDELHGIIGSPKPSVGLEYIRSIGLMDYIIPELLEGLGVEQKGNHRYDVYYHSIYSCDGAPQSSALLRWAALLHDIGKPAVRERDELGIYTFHRHEQVSSQMADRVLRRLCFSNQEREHILHLIHLHMFHYTPDWSDAAVRRFINQAGPDSIEDLFRLRAADQYGTFGAHLRRDGNDELRSRIEKIRSEQDALSLKDLCVNGKDLMDELSIAPGKEIGTVLNALLEAVLDDPKLNDRETLLEIGKKFYEEYLLGK